MAQHGVDPLDVLRIVKRDNKDKTIDGTACGVFVENLLRGVINKNHPHHFQEMNAILCGDLICVKHIRVKDRCISGECLFNFHLAVRMGQGGTFTNTHVLTGVSAGFFKIHCLFRQPVRELFDFQNGTTKTLGEDFALSVSLRSACNEESCCDWWSSTLLFGFVKEGRDYWTFSIDRSKIEQKKSKLNSKLLLPEWCPSSMTIVSFLECNAFMDVDMIMGDLFVRSLDFKFPLEVTH